jgi:hypothetical protein
MSSVVLHFLPLAAVFAAGISYRMVASSEISTIDVPRWEEYRSARYELIEDGSRMKTWCFQWNSAQGDIVMRDKKFLPRIENSSTACTHDNDSDLLKQHLVRLSAPLVCNVNSLVTVEPVPYGFGSTISSWIKVSDSLRVFLEST